MKFSYGKQLALWVVLLLCSATAQAQDSSVEMADVMRQNGKIYVVVAVALVVMTGILVYMTMLDKKISSLEKKIKDQSKP